MLASHQDAVTNPLNGRRSTTNRSRVTNGKSVFLDGIDQRSSLARRFRDLVALHSHDLSPRGPEHLTQAQQQLIKRVASLEVQLETMEGKMIEGVSSTDDIEVFARISSHLRRMLETLGLDRVMTDATPTVAQVAAAGFGSEVHVTAVAKLQRRSRALAKEEAGAALAKAAAEAVEKLVADPAPTTPVETPEPISEPPTQPSEPAPLPDELSALTPCGGVL